ncbi:unnamed protein product [Vicia faba]|uniref:Uncharacterized protein n=1 Tax=Vicia faba TaxID=3906 RepID=A0AAV1AH36_VICFA|nr:unnamed protein product [Vicia faba]
MDSYQQPPHGGYMRPPQPPPPPPPHTADPHQQHHQYHQMPPPPPPQGPWFTPQFQYQTPSPPQQWPPPPTPTPPPPPPSNPYSYHPSQFPPPPPHHARPPPQFQPHSHIPQAYPQEWNNNPGWPQNQAYPVHTNEEDWAAKARAWADAKSAMETQHPQSHYSHTGRLPEQTHYHDPYQQSVDPRYTDVQNQSHPSSGYQQFSFVDPAMQRNSGHSQEAASVSLEAAYTSDGHSYSARDGTSIGDPTVSFEQANFPTNPSVHPQEVPTSYSSVAGKEAADQVQQSYAMFPLPSSSSQEQYHAQPSMHAPSFASHSHSVDSSTNLADQPLDFAPRFSRDGDPQMQSTYNHHDSGSSMNNWGAPVAPGVGYPPIPPSLSSGPQHDPSFTTPGHVAAPYGRFPGPGHPSTIPPNGAPYSLSTVATVHPTAAFSADAYGISGVPERPKKAPVPNWLREEIKKTVIAAPSADHPKVEETLVGDDIDKSYMKADDEIDSKSVDSSRSAEDEEDEEVEVARTAAINQEIKKILTEVLLKVTDELFDEIATKVLSEDDLTPEVDHNVATSNHKASTSPPSALVPKATAKVLVPVKAKERENDGANENSNSSSPGDVLGLGNYGSDADDEIESSTVPAPAKDAAYMVNNVVKTNSSLSRNGNGAAIDQLLDAKITKEDDHSDSSKIVSKDTRDNGLEAIERSHDRFNGFRSEDMSGVPRSELPGKNGVEKATNDHHGKESRRKSEKNDRHDRSSSEKDSKEVKISHKTRTDGKGDESKRRKEERNQKKEHTDYISESKERVKEHNVRHVEKAKEPESRKRSSRADVRDDRRGAEKPHRGSTAEDTSRRKEHTKDKGEHKSRRREARDHDRHRRRRSSSVSSRGRTSKDHLVNHADDSSGEGSDGSKRKLHSRKRDLSPSPVRSKRRQVSRSPHSKRSQRRHSPYSSLDNSRGRRSRSRSPVRRHR